MKDYLNRKEVNQTALILATEVYINQFLDNDFFSPDERKKIQKAEKALKEFKKLLFDRIGEVYLRKIKGYIDSNQIGFYCKGIVRDTVAETVDDEIIQRLLDASGWALDCFDCDRTDFKNCKRRKK